MIINLNIDLISLEEVLRVLKNILEESDSEREEVNFKETTNLLREVLIKIREVNILLKDCTFLLRYFIEEELKKADK